MDRFPVKVSFYLLSYCMGEDCCLTGHFPQANRRFFEGSLFCVFKIPVDASIHPPDASSGLPELSQAGDLQDVSVSDFS